MSTSFESQDTLVRSVQLKVQSVMISADLEAGTTEDPAMVTITNGGSADVTIEVDIAEDVKKVHKVTIYDRVLGTAAAQLLAPVFSGSVIEAHVDASALALDDCSVEVHYEVE